MREKFVAVVVVFGGGWLWLLQWWWFGGCCGGDWSVSLSRSDGFFYWVIFLLIFWLFLLAIIACGWTHLRVWNKVKKVRYYAFIGGCKTRVIHRFFIECILNKNRRGYKSCKWDGTWTNMFIPNLRIYFLPYYYFSS